LTWRYELAKFLRMKRVNIGEFRNRASELVRRAAGGETIIIMNRNREVAKVVPVSADPGQTRLVGCLRGTAEILGDVEAPIAAPDAWFRSA
jgi:prevent-host-death family protein